MVAKDDDKHGEHDEELWWPIHLFLDPRSYVKFPLHRLFGLCYLIQYAAAAYLYWSDYERFAASPLVWSLPLNGVVQSLTATYYFRFLHRASKDPGYYGSKGTLSWNFVAENCFYSTILLFQWLYMSDRFYPSLRRGIIIEAAFVFLPYMWFRPLVPKTSFRDGLYNDTNKLPGDRDFFYYATWVTKLFYPWAKWAIGFLLNYLRYADKLSARHTREMYCLLIFACWATTISLFTHTLRFKGYISARTSFGVYVASYMATFISIVRMADLFIASPLLCGFAALGLLLNSVLFAPAWLQHGVQIGIMGLMWAHREGKIDLVPYGY